MNLRALEHDYSDQSPISLPAETAPTASKEPLSIIWEKYIKELIITGNLVERSEAQLLKITRGRSGHQGEQEFTEVA